MIGQKSKETVNLQKGGFDLPIAIDTAVGKENGIVGR